MLTVEISRVHARGSHANFSRRGNFFIDTRVPCGGRFRKHPSSSRRTMGCCASKINDQPSASTTRQEMSQREVARAPSRSSQRSRANSEHRSLHGGDVPKRERPPSNSNLQKRQPVTFDEDVPPVPSRARTRALTTASSSRNTGTPPSAGECYRRWSA